LSHYLSITLPGNFGNSCICCVTFGNESHRIGPLAKLSLSQAFHWFAHNSSLQEIHRVLDAHGVLGMIWNIEDYNAPKNHKATTSWEQKIQDLTWTFDDNEPRFRHEQWRKVFEDQVKSTPLSLIIAADPMFAMPLGEHHESWVVRMSGERLWERYCTLSQIAMQEGEALEVG